MKKQKTKLYEAAPETIILRGFIYEVYFADFRNEEDRDWQSTFIMAEDMAAAMGKVSRAFPGRSISMLTRINHSFCRGEDQKTDRLIP